MAFIEKQNQTEIPKVKSLGTFDLEIEKLLAKISDREDKFAKQAGILNVQEQKKGQKEIDALTAELLKWTEDRKNFEAENKKPENTPVANKKLEKIEALKKEEEELDKELEELQAQMAFLAEQIAKLPDDEEEKPAPVLFADPAEPEVKKEAEIEPEQNPGDYAEVVRLARFFNENPREPMDTSIIKRFNKYHNFYAKVNDIEKRRNAEILGYKNPDVEETNKKFKEIDAKYDAELAALGVKIEEKKEDLENGKDTAKDLLEYSVVVDPNIKLENTFEEQKNERGTWEMYKTKMEKNKVNRHAETSKEEDESFVKMAIDELPNASAEDFNKKLKEILMWEERGHPSGHEKRKSLPKNLYDYVTIFSSLDSVENIILTQGLSEDKWEKAKTDYKSNFPKLDSVKYKNGLSAITLELDKLDKLVKLVRKEVKDGQSGANKGTEKKEPLDLEAKKAEIERRRQEELAMVELFAETEDGKKYPELIENKIRNLNKRYDTELATLGKIPEIKKEKTALEKEKYDIEYRRKQELNSVRQGRDASWMYDEIILPKEDDVPKTRTQKWVPVNSKEEAEKKINAKYNAELAALGVKIEVPAEKKIEPKENAIEIIPEGFEKLSLEEFKNLKAGDTVYEYQLQNKRGPFTKNVEEINNDATHGNYVRFNINDKGAIVMKFESEFDNDKENILLKSKSKNLVNAEQKAGLEKVDFYLGVPNEKGEFSDSENNKTKKILPSITAYKFDVNGDTARFELDSNPEVQNRAINQRSTYAMSVSASQNEFNPDVHTKIITVTPGEAEKRGDKWVMTKKAKIRYE